MFSICLGNVRLVFSLFPSGPRPRPRATMVGRTRQRPAAGRDRARQAAGRSWGIRNQTMRLPTKRLVFKGSAVVPVPRCLCFSCCLARSLFPFLLFLSHLSAPIHAACSTFPRPNPKCEKCCTQNPVQLYSNKKWSNKSPEKPSNENPDQHKCCASMRAGVLLLLLFSRSGHGARSANACSVTAVLRRPRVFCLWLGAWSLRLKVQGQGWRLGLGFACTSR